MSEALLSRLQSEGASRELDAEIALANGWKCEASESIYQDRDSYWRSPTGQICPQPPRYTESIDAALTLLDGHGDYTYAIEKMMIWPRLPSRVAIVGVHLYDEKYWHEFEDGRWEAEAATPALALLIAIQKAKEESKP